MKQSCVGPRTAGDKPCHPTCRDTSPHLVRSPRSSPGEPVLAYFTPKATGCGDLKDQCLSINSKLSSEKKLPSLEILFQGHEEYEHKAKANHKP